MAKAEFCSKELVDLVFPGIKSLIIIHEQLNNEMKAKMKEDPLVSVKDVANMLLSRFDGEAGEKMKEICALFCRNHSYALNVLKDKRKRDSKLQELLHAAEINPLCRRLQFKDLLISEVHRLTKYPLLIDSMCNYVTSQSDEHRLLTKAARCSRDILAHVNHAVKDCENHHKLVALQKRLDTRQIQNSANPLVANYKNLNLQDYKLIYEGALTWRLSPNRTKQQIDLHAVLLEEMLVLLQIQDDGKLVLKCQSQISTQSKDDSKFDHSPIITLNSMLVRQVATDKKALFIINTSQLGPQIYDLVAHSVDEKKRWFKYISEAAESQKKSNTIRRVPVNKSNLTLAEASNDEAVQDSLTSDAGQDLSRLTTNNNNTSEGNDGWKARPSYDPPSYDQIAHGISSQPPLPQLTETLHSGDADRKLDSISGDDDGEVSSTCEALQDVVDDGERDPKSLLLASISDTLLLKQFLSSSSSNTASSTAAAAAANASTASLNAAAVAAMLSSPAAASKAESCALQAASSSDHSLSVLNSLSRRLNSLLELLEERENERVRLQHQLKTAEQLLRDTPKDMADSRPNSFVSNSSSSASVGETSDSQINAMTSSIPVIPPVIQTAAEAIHSAPVNNVNNSMSASSSVAESDSDDEGTVYADTKEDLSDGGNHDEIKLHPPVQRPDSSMSDVSNAHTESTLLSVENLAYDTSAAPNNTDIATSNADQDNITPDDRIPELNVESASSTPDSSDCEIEKTNIDDLVSSPGSVPTPADQYATTDIKDMHITNDELTTAAAIVEEAMKAAMDIMKNSQEIDASTDLSSNMNGEQAQELNCENIDEQERVNIIQDDISNKQQDSAVAAATSSGDIDDSDEADALSASSLD